MGMLGMKASDREYPQFQDDWYESNMLGSKSNKKDEPPYNINSDAFQEITRLLSENTYTTPLPSKDEIDDMIKKTDELFQCFTNYK